MVKLYLENERLAMLINKEKSCLTIIDVQERLTPAVKEPGKVINGCARLLKGAGILGVPTLITEQYPKGLGPSMADIRNAAPEGTPFIAKTTMSALRNDEFTTALAALNKKQVVIAGVEEHICVFQTAVELKEAGYDVFVVADASSSRSAESVAVAEKRFMTENIPLVTVEMVLFEWLRVSGTPEFKEIQAKLVC